MNIKFIVGVATLLCCIYLAESQAPRRRRPRPLVRGPMQINIQDKRPTSVQIGFTRVSGAFSYKISAKEWIDGSFEQTVATSEQRVGVHQRNVILGNLIPGREFLIQVQALRANGRRLQSVSEVISTTNLRCYTCNGRASNSECRLQDCPRGTDSCLNEVRFQNGRKTITKRCSQFQPRLARVIQNGQDVTKACSGTNTKDAVCRCMCKSDSCNNAELPCGNTCFPRLTTRAGLTLSCTRSNTLGSVCTWKCGEGERLIGTSSSTCRTDRTWSVLTPPRCVKPVVEKDTVSTFVCPVLSEFRSGDISCTRSNQFGSICTYSCARGQRLIGSATRTCQGGGRWSGAQPTCSVIRCPTIPTTIFADCTASTRLGSTCELACANQLTLVGVNEITCLPTGRWSTTLPTCVRRGCQARPRTGANVLSECEDFVAPQEGAACQYSCRPGYIVQGQTSLTCTRNRWNGSPPICIRTRCQPALAQPSFGFLTCSNQQNYGSVCTFTCHNDFVLIGEATSTCTRTTQWSSEEPRCQAVSCPRVGDFAFGSYSCNNDNRERSTCSFRCTSGYGFPSGTRNRITCRRASKVSSTSRFAGEWTYPIPQCQPIRCPALVTENGLTRSCNRENYRSRGTTCTFRCPPGYSVSGRSRTTCINGISGRSTGRWSAPTPICIRRKCRNLASILFGEINCTDEMYAGSVCTATCDRGYEPIGNTEIVCNDDARWSSRNPTCQRVVCKVPRLPSADNFVYECGTQNPSSRLSEFFTDFECPLACSVGFSIIGGNTTMCGEDGNWIVSGEVTCNDINECVETSENPCEQVCDNYVGGFDCSCGENYVLEPDQRTCRLMVCTEFNEDPERTLSCTDGRLIGSTCQLSCSTGYEPRGGASTFTCRPGGSWNREQATCMKVECVKLSAPANGKINCTDDNVYQSLCISECNEGYEMLGFGLTECTSRGVWTFDTPTCSRIQCFVDAISLANGVAICTDSNFYDSSCQYFCDSGYQLSGVPEGAFFIPFRSCTAEGRWTDVAPVCEKKQCKPILSEIQAERQIGTIVCSDGDLFKSTCTFTCPTVGYELIGHNRITCLASQEWSQSLGQCQKVQCPSRRIPTNGGVKCSDFNIFESECSYTCEVGHQLVGSAVSSCQADRSWTSAAPTCERIRCTDDRSVVSNGTVDCTESNLYGSICSTNCNPGYIFDEETSLERFRKTEIIGSFERGLAGGPSDIIEATCLASGEWSEIRPVCTKHLCEPSADFLDQVRSNGDVLCTEGSLFLSVCRLVCEVGYEVVGGDDVMECGVSAQWDTQLGQCQKVICEAFEGFENGVMECSDDFKFESNCVFTCDAGYDLIGEPSSICQFDRTFSNEQPFCQKITCPETHLVLENGNATCTDGFRFESRCEYVCNPGYEMVSSPDAVAEESADVAVLTCEADRSWSGELPFCRRKRCSKLDGALIKAGMSGELSCTESDYFGSQCTVACRDGYVLVGPASTHCSANADWEPTIGFCERIQCPEIILPTNSVVKCSNDNKFESNCTFTCNRGYELIGSSSTTCLADKTYSEDFPTCREIVCPIHFTSLNNGIASCSKTNKFASRCDYECFPGYKFSEFSSRFATCQSNYNWNVEDSPSCEKRTCSQSDPILIQGLQHGRINCTEGNLYESQCTLTCDTGYELTSGMGLTICRADQTWEIGLGYCQKITCADLDVLNNGGVSCTEGNRFLSVCSFNCDPGYELVGSDSTTCQASREFDNQVPTCQKTTCPEAHLSIEDGSTSCTETNLFESVCSYECDSGYEITSGSDESMCQDDQTWSKEAAECQKKICPFDHESILRADENGHITCTEGFVFESLCSLSCDNGYELVADGNNVTRCGADAEWVNELDYCTKISCPVFDEIENGEMECSEDSLYLSNCRFTCISGYELVGLPVSSCQADMTWTNPMPECIKISCPRSFLSLSHGITTCTGSNRFRSTCSYDCDRGYEMSESDVNSTTCNADRTWTNQKPTCSKKKCPANDASLSKARITGTVTCSEESFFESTCQLTCPVGYEIANGQSEITCLDTAEWNGEIGFCQRIRCGEVAAPSNGDVSCANEDQFESSCAFECNAGYFLIGEYFTTCLADRTYSNDVPECRKTNCSGDHLEITFGSVTCTEENFFESECSYTCDVGYHFFDNDFVTSEVMTSQCLANQVWSEVIPICEKKTCPSQDEDFLLAHDTGIVVCSEANRFGTTCEISCSVGSELIGASTISCNSDGNWNDTIGHCQIRECPLFDIPLFGELSCTDGQNYQSECQYVCDEGYEFKNNEGESETSLTVVCQPDETWTVTILPECEKKGCPTDHFDEFEYGTINCTESNLFGTECLFECDEGFELVNPRDSRFTTSVVVRCESDAQWDFPDPPRARRISCSPNATFMQENEQHGKITCTDGSNFESECSIQCNRGYELAEGVESVTCGSESEWSGLLGTCQKIECSVLAAPDNAQITCSDDFLFKSHCRIMCDAGYDIVDPEDEYDREKGISCRADGSWCGDVPTCEKILCSDDHLTIENGFVECSDDNIFQSACSYSCDQGYHMIEGQSDSAECNSDGSWSSEVPVCENNRCPANDTSLSEARINGDVTCTDENKFGSQCRLKCFSGYEMTGEPETNCLHSSEWSNGLGLCQRITCVTPNLVPFATIECSNDFKFQSLCVYNCQSGYERIDKGNSLVEITHDLKCEADGFWTGLEAECDKISCPTAGYIDMANGIVECTDGARFGSRCSFTCHPGFELIEPESDDVTLTFVTCTATGAWDKNVPMCRPLSCTESSNDLDNTVANGAVACDKGSLFGSKCELECNDGYRPSNLFTSTSCGVDKKWWPQLSSCELVQCPFLEVEGAECTDENNLNSECTLSCEEGTESGEVKCNSNGQWEGTLPSCSGYKCNEEYLYVENGNVDSEKNEPGSTINYSCEEGFVLIGQSQVTCLGSGNWDSDKPSCEVMKCPPLNLVNGELICSNEETYNAVGSLCSYSCNRLFELQGDEQVTCQPDGTWSSNEIPFCKGHCDLRFDSFENGEVNCSNGNYIHSKCSFRCASSIGVYQEPVSLYGSDSMTCQENGRWDGTPPCCSRSCPPWAKVDLFFVLDSSSSVSFEGWRKVLDFVNQVIETFNVGPENALAGVFRFNRDVDVRGEIPIGKYDALSTLQHAITFLPYGGWGTNIGRALDYVTTNALKAPGNRPDAKDYVIVLTDGNSKDNVTEPAEALKDSGATVFTVGFSDSDSSLEQLEVIASNPSNAFVVNGGFDGLDLKLSQSITSSICENPCLLKQSYRTMMESYITN